MAGKIFINYRRDDAIGTAGRLHDRLAQKFGRDNLFMDVDHIPVGADFVEYLHSQVAACDVFLAVIGPNWLNAKDERGRRRFDNPDDFVTIEIAAALARNIRVIPVLVDGARTPKADRLPDPVKPLVRRNAVEVRNTHFGRDAEALANKVREALTVARPVRGLWPLLASAASRLIAPGRWRLVAGSATALLLVGWVGLYQMGVPVWVPWTPRAVPQQFASGVGKSKTVAEAEAQRIERYKQAAEARRKAEAEAEALISQGDTDMRNGDYDGAIATFTEAIRLISQGDHSRGAADLYIYRGAAYTRKGDTDRAIADYNEAIRLDPNFLIKRRDAFYAVKGNERALAIAEYDRAIATALCNWGKAKLRTNDDSGNADIAKARQLDALICR